MAVEPNSLIAEQLSNLIQPKLVELGWTTEGLDDSALTEYVVLMLVNGKSQTQIASELSQDLLNLGPEDSSTSEFAQWLFGQVNHLAANPGVAQSERDFGVASGEQQPATGFAVGEQLDTGQSGDTFMQSAGSGDIMDGVQGNIPTGPRSMRRGPRSSAKRMMGQLNKAMDRSIDPMHKVRAQSGERINMHSRPPPKGPRGAPSQPRAQSNGVPTGPNRSLAPPLKGSEQMNPQLLFQQQQQMLQMLQQMLPQAAHQFQTQGGPIFNPNFQNGGREAHQQQGRTLFDRIEARPTRNNHALNNRKQQPHAAPDTDVEGDASMDVDKPNEAEPSPETVCKFNLRCTKSDCPYAHQSPAAPPGTAIDVADHCPFGAACQNRKCTARHPSPAQKKMHQSEQDCKYFPNCTNPHCTFRHPAIPLCRNGADCTREGCRFTHLQTACKFNPCLNATCPYKHAEGQKRGKFGEGLVWRAPGAENDQELGKDHVSERKFVTDGDGEEELIGPASEQEGMVGQEHHEADITVS